MFCFKKLLIIVSVITYLFFPASILVHAQTQEVYPYEQLAQIFETNEYSTINSWVKINEINYPNWIELYVRYAHYLLQVNLTQEAIVYFEKAINLPYASDYQIFYWLSNSYALLGQYPQALNYAKLFWQDEPDNEQAFIEYIWLLYKNLQLNEALEIAIYQQNTFEQSFFLYSMIALIYGDIGDYEQATTYYTLARSSHEYRGYSRQLLLTNLYNQYLMEINFFQFTKAYALLEEALSIDPESAHILRAMALFYHGQMEFELSQYYYLLAESSEIAAAQKDQSLRTPLGKIGLIDLYLDFAMLDQAYDLIQEVVRQRDYYTWMRNFSLSPNFFEPILHKQELRYWEIKHKNESAKLVRGITQRFVRWANIRDYAFRIRQKKLDVRRSQVSAVDYARSQAHLESVLRYAAEAREGYLFLHSNTLATSQHILVKPIDQLEVSIKKLESNQKSRNSYETIISKLTLPYQNRIKFSLINSVVDKYRFKNKQERSAQLWMLYAYSPFWVQQRGLPIQMDLSLVARPKQAKRFLRYIHLKEAKNSPYLLALSEQNSQLIAKFYYEGKLLWQWQEQVDVRNLASTYDALRVQIFSCHVE